MSKHEVGIRAATEADLPAVVELIRGLAEFERLPGPDETAADRLRQHFRQGRFGLVVAEGTAGLVAYALYFFNYSTFNARPSLFLEDLYVRPESRSAGIGARLLGHLARVAVAEGCCRFEWTVLDWNERAQSFYRSLGARVLPDWRVCRVDGAALAALGQKDDG
jgi:GNAT superfamily N-acetyltransferase